MQVQLQEFADRFEAYKHQKLTLKCRKSGTQDGFALKGIQFIGEEFAQGGSKFTQEGFVGDNPHRLMDAIVEETGNFDFVSQSQWGIISLAADVQAYCFYPEPMPYGAESAMRYIVGTTVGVTKPLIPGINRVESDVIKSVYDQRSGPLREFEVRYHIVTDAHRRDILRIAFETEAGKESIRIMRYRADDLQHQRRREIYDLNPAT